MKIYIKKTPFKTEADLEFSVEELNKSFSMLPSLDLYHYLLELVYSMKEQLK